MTRINIVPVETLSNKHLMAEYRELPRVFTHVRKHGVATEIPAQYTLGKGHVNFFTNKLEWLYNRYIALYDELWYRGYELDGELFNTVCDDAELLLPVAGALYEPTPEELYLNMARLVKRSEFNRDKAEIDSKD